MHSGADVPPRFIRLRFGYADLAAVENRKTSLTPAKLSFFGEDSLRNAVVEYLAHYHLERNHQGLNNQLIIPMEEPPDINQPIQKTQRLGGMLNSYRRAG